jgi:SAM-dependent methyltransferase
VKILTGVAQETYWEGAKYLDSHDPVARAYALPKVAHIQKYVDLQEASILDVACGNGTFTSLFSGLAPRAVGIDYSPSMLRRNAARPLLRGVAEQLPFRGDSFDVVFAACLLHHTAQPQEVVREMARVSRRHVVVIEPNRLNPVMFLFSLLVQAEHGGLRSSAGYLSGLMENAGLEVVRCSAMGMISQNNTPHALVPWLKQFDREFRFGEYLVAIGTK